MGLRGRGSRALVLQSLVAAAAASVAHGLQPATFSALPRAARVLGTGLGSFAADSSLGSRQWGPAHARWTCYSGPDDASTPGVLALNHIAGVSACRRASSRRIWHTRKCTTGRGHTARHTAGGQRLTARLHAQLRWFPCLLPLVGAD